MKQGEDWWTALHTILIFLITPTTTWLIAGYPNTTETQKVTRILNKNSSSNWIHSIHMGSMNNSHCNNLFTNSCHHISTNGKAPTHSQINLQHPTILPFALTKGYTSKRQLSKSGGYSSTHLIRPNFHPQKQSTLSFNFMSGFVTVT